ncbi:MAG: uncharacterized protein JWN92_2856 [Candidatus Acidoferrum typicum]|nr:uncharacterized protein [Candidatus Acidoferrum typicum]
MRRISDSARQPGLAASSAPRALATNHYEQLPLAFEPTAPEAAGDAKFLARGQGYALFLTPRETVLALGTHSGSSAALRLKMVGANASPTFAALDELPGKSNYFLGKSPAKWRTNVPNYRKVAESSIYNGIDIIYYGNQRQLEYDFVVAPGANPEVIQIEFQGAKNLRFDSAGDLLVNVGAGDVRLHKPIAYQGSGDAKHEVAASYVMKTAQSVSFQLARYDAGEQLIIDPVLSYSTYLGGSEIDVGNAIAVAQDGTAFIAGGTFSADFPTVHKLPMSSEDHPQDAFVAKISADGSTLLYSTFLGGRFDDVANGIAVDAAGDAYVTGTTHSFDFPVTFDSFNPVCGGDGKCGASWNTGGLIVSNAFVTKLNPAGSEILYSGFLGEYEHVRGLAIAVDQNEAAYVTGDGEANFTPTVTITAPATGPPDCPRTNTIPFGGGTTDAFVTKISATGTTIEYSTYLGGISDDSGPGISVDNAGNAFVVGVTHSADFPVTPGAAQTNYGGAGDAFVTEVNTNLPQTLGYSTFIGGAELDHANGVALDANGNVYVAGGAISNNLFPSAAGFAKLNSGNGDAFAAKLNPAVPGTAGVIYFTYLGGSKADSAAGIAVDGSGNAYVTGSTVSAAATPSDPLAIGFPIIADTAFQPTYGGGNADAFVTELNPTGTTLVYSSYLGGTNTEGAGGIAVDTAGSAYVTGQTCSPDFPVSNALQKASAGNCDAYISKVTIQHGLAVNPGSLVFLAQNQGTTSAPQTLTITNGDTPVTITSIVISGPQSGDYAVTNNICITSLPQSGQCTFDVTFTPTGAGIRKAVITINNSISSVVVNVTGSTSPQQNSDFTITTSQPTATVSAGHSAKFPVTITPGTGFSQSVTLSCSGLPRGAACLASANPVPVGGGPSIITVTITTAERTFVPMNFRKFGFPGNHFVVVLLPAFIVFLSMMILGRMRFRPATGAFGLAIVSLLLASACGGNPSGVPAGTPAGTSQVVVTATSGSVTHSTTLTLIVN